MGPIAGSITYEGCALVNQFNLSAPQSADCTVPHCRGCCVTARSSGFWWLVQSLGLRYKTVREFHQHQQCYNRLNLTCHPRLPSLTAQNLFYDREQKEASCAPRKFPSLSWFLVVSYCFQLKQKLFGCTRS